MANFSRYAGTVAVFAAVLYAALVVATFGMISLYADRDVIADPTAGPLVGPIMASVSILIVLLCFVAIAVRVPAEKQRISSAVAALIGFGAYLFFCISGSIMVGAGSGDPFGFMTFLASQLASPFAIAVGILAFIITILFMLVLATKVGEGKRPKWPWEKHDS